jgi:peptidyl-dipeptidase A
MRIFLTALVGAASLCVLASCKQASEPADEGTKESAHEFVARINKEMQDLSHKQSVAGWDHATNITPETEAARTKADEAYLEYFTRAVEEAKRYDGQQLAKDDARAIELLKLDVSAPAPKDPQKRSELTQILTRLDSMYGAGKYCPKGPDSCRDLTQLEDVIFESRNYDELTEAWTGWHSVGAQMRGDYERFVELANEGARELGYPDLGAMWRSGYDMAPEAFMKEAARLYSQVEPLYKELHCYARGRLAAKYGEDKVPAGKPIPVPLLGNMWAQQWNKIYPDILKPYPKASIESADGQLEKQKWDAVRMAKSAESFYTSIGFPTLPASFWERSMLVKPPAPREVICHASAWDMDTPGMDDVRIKMCTKPTEEDLFTIYHELGHVYYYLWYRNQPYLFQDGAHDGFHEAVGDAVNLSVTPAYLHSIGLVSAVKPSREAVLNQQMKMATEKIAFLPFGKVIDEWRWRVFSGEVKPENYNSTWWALRTQYQGVAPPVERTEKDFDPGAKYHVPGNTPYTRYFLSFIIQFQFHKAMCDAAGHKGPLHECSIAGNKEAGRRFGEMLALGASQPWPDTLEKLTGTRQMDARALMEYFAPLSDWLKERNAGQKCGWDAT